jgi:biopolymer transport protein ExbD
LISVSGRLRNRSGRVRVNMGPLIDMVFLLLIFFVATTSFVKEAGIEVQRSTAATAQTRERMNIMIGVTDAGEVYWQGSRIDARSVRAHVERALADDPESGVIVVADRRSETGVVIQVMDQCRLAGAVNVSLAAERGTE